MNKTKGFFITIFLLTILLLPIIPVRICEDSESNKPDLTINDINDTHNPLRTKHTAWIWYQNIGTYPAQDDFVLTLYFVRHNKETYLTIMSIVKMWTIPGLALWPWSSLKTYTHTWTNPDPDVWEA
jgi:hypothetical protein